MNIFLDKASTSIPCQEAIEVAKSLLYQYGNPSSVHRLGLEARSIIERARTELAEMLKVQPFDITFTSGATESNATLLRGLKYDLAVSSYVEHYSILQNCIENKTILINCRDMELDIEKLTEVINTAKLKGIRVLSIFSYVNSETGTILDIQTIRNVIGEDNILVLDVSQALARVDIPNEYIDFLTFSLHKFYSFMGIGAIVNVSHKFEFESLLKGGGQEFGRRSGTENIIGICAGVEGLKYAFTNKKDDSKKIYKIWEFCNTEILKHNGFNINFKKNIFYGIISLKYPLDIRPDLLVFKLSQDNIYVSAGSACTSGSVSYSHVLLHAQPGLEKNTIRVSFDGMNTARDIKTLLEKLVYYQIDEVE